MASFPTAPWASAPTSVSSPAAAAAAAASSSSSFSSVLFPPKRFKSNFSPFASSSNDGASAKETEARDRVQLAFSKAKAYRKNKISAPATPPVPAQKPSNEPPAGGPNRNLSETEASIAVKLAMEKAKEYKKNTEVSAAEPRDPGISSKDFPGLSFSENKGHREKPLGFVTPAESLLEGDVQKVEFIVGDKSKFERNTRRASSSSDVDDGSNLYKPKVSTWGVFPRPKNISKTFGGGRVIASGEMLETPETREAKEKRSKELISAYKGNMGSIIIDAKTQDECEKALKEGDILMDMGQLRGALPYYEKVMKNVVFETELYGLAALQWSICQDSLSRSNEARIMYEKLQSHSKAEVRKQARQFMFSFQAMEMLNVRDTSSPKETGFEDYFEAFVNNEAGHAPLVEETNESVLKEVFPYLIFLLSPIFIIIFVVIKRSF
ncbi:hypothetical protein KSP39_PZI009005 [Platanthera zijinensis]|uniref:Uncharacterized protein n=1 Tax=Platanthera zijinensis TaxID=2320716 RepID=A0AAP0BLN3_9ASPA